MTGVLIRKGIETDIHKGKTMWRYAGRELCHDEGRDWSDTSNKPKTASNH